jgi:peptide/nickel transport system substrate-binding protein
MPSSPRSALSNIQPAALAAAALILLSACPSDVAKRTTRGAGRPSPGGTLVIALPADVETFLPPYASFVQTKLAVDLLFDRLADLGDSVNTIGDQGFVPRLAERWQWSRDSLAITFHLDPRARWHDGAPVRAADVLFTYALYKDTTAGIEIGTALSSIDSVTSPDSLTATFWFKRRYPEQFFDATYQMIICPEHLLRGLSRAELRSSDFGHRPVGNGRFRFVSWTPGSTVDLVADTGNYLGRPYLNRIVLSIAPNYAAGLTKLLSGEADFYEVIHPDNVDEVRKSPSLVLKPYDDPSYGFVWFNLRTVNPARPHPVLGDARVRRALAMALDRESMVRNVLDTLAFVAQGPFSRSSPAADTALRAWPYDTGQANHLLDSAGWHRGKDGIRYKNGQPLALSVIVPTSSKIRQQFAVLLQDQWANIGARVSVDAVELRVLVDRLRHHDFDAALQVWKTDASVSDVKQTWTKAAERDGMNWGSYEDPAFDALIDSALTTSDPARMHALFHRAYLVINRDVPAVWLYQSRQVAGMQRRIHPAYMRPDAWWAHLAQWYVPADERLPRDTIGAGR